jgi:hypothetical protein
METNGYSAQSRTFLTQAKDELAQGDSVQASEKLWGAAAQIVKAVAARRGWPHRSHRDLYVAVDRCVAETGDDELFRLFQVASAQHMNFYENLQPLNMVRSAVPELELFVEKLERL